MVFCVRKRKDISDKEFYDYWKNSHGPLVSAKAAALNIRRYVQSHTTHNELGTGIAAQRGMKVLGYDGVAEIWWDSLEAMLSVFETQEGQAASAMLAEDEARFVDMESSTIFFTEEHVVVGS